MRKLLGLVAALALLGASTASAGPFVGIGSETDRPYLELGWRKQTFTGWIRLYPSEFEEQTLSYRLSLGGEVTATVLGELSFGGGLRFTTLLQRTPDKAWLSLEHWGPHFMFKWEHRPLAIFTTVYLPISVQFVEDAVVWGFEKPRLEVGFRYLLSDLRYFFGTGRRNTGLRPADS